jgi:hypothetical protein
VFIVPIKTPSGPNAREIWQVKAARVKKERQATAWMLKTVKRPAIPCSVNLTRLSAGTVDDDNLPSSLKAVRDQIAEWLGVDDRHRNIVRYVYHQRKVARGQFGVEVSFGPPVSGAQLSLGVEVEA